MKKIILTIVCFIICNYLFSQNFQWVKNEMTSHGNSVVRDKIGNIYVANTVFIAKYNANGILNWQQNLSGHGIFGIKDIIADNNNNLYVFGGVNGTITIGNFTLVSDPGMYNIFLFKVDSSGIIKWVSRSHDNASNSADAMTLDLLGNPLIIGRFADSLYLGSYAFDGPNTSQVYLAKYSPGGNCIWAKHLKSVSFDGGSIGPKVRTDTSGNIYVSGHFLDHASFDNITIQAHGYYDEDIFLAKFDSSGNALWAKVLGGYQEERFGTMDVDSAGNSYITGYFSSTPAYFDTYTLTAGSSYYFTCKYDKDGNCLWTHKGGQGMICAVNDGFYSNGPGFVSKWDEQGLVSWTKNVSGRAYNYGMTATNDAVYITGTDSGAVSFDTCMLNNSNWQMFLAKLAVPQNATGLSELANGHYFTIYPNPSNGRFTVSIPAEEGASLLTVRNSLGQLVYSKQIKNHSGYEVDLSSQPGGIYFAELIQGNKRSVQKIILH
jgi:hypothetical protein